MKKKLLFLLTLTLSAIFLVACSGGLDGEYYGEYNGKLDESPWVVIEDKTLTYYLGGKDDSDGTVVYSIDEKSQTLIGERGVVPYKFKDGVFTAMIGGNTSYEEYYRKDSQKYKELKKD